MNQRALIHRLISKCRDYENMVIENVCKLDLLEQQLKEARDAASDAEESAAWQAERAESKARQLRQDLEDARRREEDRRYQEYKETEALDRLKRAQSYGDEWGVSRAMRELEDIRRW